MDLAKFKEELNKTIGISGTKSIRNKNLCKSGINPSPVSEEWKKVLWEVKLSLSQFLSIGADLRLDPGFLGPLV